MLFIGSVDRGPLVRTVAQVLLVLREHVDSLE